MKATVPEELELFRCADAKWYSDRTYGFNGLFMLPRGLKVIASDGDGWDHVSVSLQDRTPTWDEMCMVKRLFWDYDECVVQYHPRESEYVNIHPFCLHMWKPQGIDVPVPPSYMVGPKAGEDCS